MRSERHKVAVALISIDQFDAFTRKIVLIAPLCLPETFMEFLMKGYLGKLADCMISSNNYGMHQSVLTDLAISCEKGVA